MAQLRQPPLPPSARAALLSGTVHSGLPASNMVLLFWKRSSMYLLRKSNSIKRSLAFPPAPSPLRPPVPAGSCCYWFLVYLSVLSIHLDDGLCNF